MGEKVVEYLMTIGRSYYPTPADFLAEAMLIGISKRLPYPIEVEENGKLRIYLVHREDPRIIVYYHPVIEKVVKGGAGTGGPSGVIVKNLREANAVGKRMCGYKRPGYYAVREPSETRAPKMSVKDLEDMDVSKNRERNANAFAVKKLYEFLRKEDVIEIEDLLLEALRKAYLVDPRAAERIQLYPREHTIEIAHIGDIHILKKPIPYSGPLVRGVMRITVDLEKGSYTIPVDGELRGIADIVKNATVEEVPIDLIDIDYPRVEKSRTYLESIKQVGVITPVILQKKSNGRYSLLDGEGRIANAKEIGEKKIRAVVLHGEMSETMKLAVSLMLNRQRADLKLEDVVNMVKKLSSRGYTKSDAVKILKRFYSESEAYRIVWLAELDNRELEEKIFKGEVGLRVMDTVNRVKRKYGKKTANRLVKEAIQRAERGENIAKAIEEESARIEAKTRLAPRLNKKERKETISKLMETIGVLESLSLKVDSGTRRKIAGITKKIYELISALEKAEEK